MDQNWTEQKSNLDPGLENLDLKDMDTWTDLDKIWIKRKMNPGPETGLKARTKYDVYSCPSLPFLRIENKAKIKRHVICSKNWILDRKR